MNYMLEQIEVLRSAKPLMDTYNKRIEAVSKTVGNLNDAEAATLAILLDNTEKQIERYRKAKNLSDMTFSEAVGPFKKHSMNIVSAVYTTLDIKSLISLQPITQKRADLYYLKYLYGSDKGKITAGQAMFTSEDKPVYSGTYQSQIVEEEPGAFTFANPDSTMTLKYAPVIDWTLVTIVITGGAAAGTYTRLGVTSTTITLQKNGGGANVGTINLTTGVVTLTAVDASAGTVKSTYKWNSEKYSSSSPVPRVKISVDQVPVTAERNQLLFDIMLDASYDFDQQFGRDMNAEMETIIIQAMQNQISFRVLDELKAKANGNGGNTYEFDLKMLGEDSFSAHLEILFRMLSSMSMQIYKNVGRGVGNKIVSGAWLIEILDILPSTVWEKTTRADIRGPYKAGTLLQKYEVFHCPTYEDDEFIMLYKGENWWESPYFLGSYLPIMASKFMMFPDMHGEQGYISMEAYHYQYPQLVVKGSLVDTTA